MSAKSTKRLVREGDDVRDALRAGDVKGASRLANRVYRLTPIEA